MAETKAYGPALVKLLKGAVYSEEANTWNLILSYHSPIREYFDTIGLELHIHENDGVALLRQARLQPDAEEEGAEARPVLPSLMRRMPLTYEVTLLCVLLREQLSRLDTGEVANEDSSRLILSREDIVELLRAFLKEHFVETSWQRQLNGFITRVQQLGFLKALSGSESDRYEVMRILKIYIRPETLEEIQEKLRTHVSGMDAKQAD